MRKKLFPKIETVWPSRSNPKSRWRNGSRMRGDASRLTRVDR
jgi:hypothetical protein